MAVVVLFCERKKTFKNSFESISHVSLSLPSAPACVWLYQFRVCALAVCVRVREAVKWVCFERKCCHNRSLECFLAAPTKAKNECWIYCQLLPLPLQCWCTLHTKKAAFPQRRLRPSQIKKECLFTSLNNFIEIRKEIWRCCVWKRGGMECQWEGTAKANRVWHEKRSRRCSLHSLSRPTAKVYASIIDFFHSFIMIIKKNECTGTVGW
jgi:hypothetical protein